MSRFICPVCKEKLTIQNKSLVCLNKHCYDLSKNGYVNLLLSSQMNSKIPGDNKMMVNSRHDFLQKGYYSALMNALCETVLSCTKNGNFILDAGCGEGYYTSNISKILKDNNITADIYGIDISKFAVDTASRKCKDVFYAAASVFHIPVKNNSTDILISVFAPYSQDEFIRILKKGGFLILVIPAENHLFELKAAVYDNPYVNEVKGYSLDGFSLIDTKKIDDTIHLSSNDDILNLFSMTPYYYKTSASDQQKLSVMDSLDTRISFEVLVYRKI